MKLRLLSALCLTVLIAGFTGCKTAPRSEEGRDTLIRNADEALRQMKTEDPTLEDFLKTAYGYVMFPEVGKGGFVVGAAYGRGIVFEQGKAIGFSDVSRASVGLQAGGQTFRELLVFENKEVFERFRQGQFTLTADASAVALRKGAAAATAYSNGVAVFTHPLGGLMFEASVGGQQFTFQPM